MQAPTTTVHLTPYVNFQGRAREAMERYHRVFGGSLDLQTMSEQGVPGPAGPGDRISQARLEAPGVVITGSDGHPSYPAKVGENIAFALGGTDRERLTAIFDGLAVGGVVKLPLTEQSWGATVGWLTDAFGINWQIDIDPA